MDVRLIAATNQNLLQAVKEGKFREDLFYRLNVFPINVPPLRERTEDIPPLTDYFIEKFNRKLGTPGRRGRPRGPGMPPRLSLAREHPGIGAPHRTDGPDGGRADPDDEARPAGDREPRLRRAPSPAELPEKPGRDILKSHMEEMERQIISRCLEECGGNVTRAAERLGLSRKGLQLKMIKHHLRKQEE